MTSLWTGQHYFSLLKEAVVPLGSKQEWAATWGNPSFSQKLWRKISKDSLYYLVKMVMVCHALLPVVPPTWERGNRGQQLFLNVHRVSGSILRALYAVTHWIPESWSSMTLKWVQGVLETTPGWKEKYQQDPNLPLFRTDWRKGRQRGSERSNCRGIGTYHCG